MADVKQVYTIINDMAEQSLGMKDLSLTNASFVMVGKTVLSSEKNLDSFYKTLVDRIGRTVIAVRQYKSDMTELDREPFVFGAIMQKISFKMPKAKNNPTWNPITEPTENLFAKYPTVFKQVFFSGFSTWEVPGTITDNQLETAFLSESAMMAFIDGIFISMYNSLEIDYENMGYAARATLIGATLYANKATCAVNLLALYNTETGSSLTVSAALRNADFLRYASSKIKLVSDRMVKMSVTFNSDGWERFTPKEKQVFEVLADFSNALDTYLQADVYHNELTKLQYYKSVPYWQASGENWDFDSVSSINLQVQIADEMEDEDTPPTYTLQTVNKTGIIAVIRDIDAVGTTIDKRRTKSIYNPHEELTNYWEKADIGYFRDDSENCVVFYMEEVAEPEAQSYPSIADLTA